MRSTIRLFICSAGLAAAALAVAQTSVYRWVDKDGNVHFTDTPPPADATGVTQKRMGGGDTDDSQLPYATQMAAKRNPVTLYTNSACGDLCISGRELLSNRGVPFAERDPGANSAAAEDLRKLAGSLIVPTLVIGANTLRGYDEDTWQAALDSAGYPRTRLPGARPRSEAPPPEAGK